MSAAQPNPNPHRLALKGCPLPGSCTPARCTVSAEKTSFHWPPTSLMLIILCFIKKGREGGKKKGEEKREAKKERKGGKVTDVFHRFWMTPGHKRVPNQHSLVLLNNKYVKSPLGLTWYHFAFVLHLSGEVFLQIKGPLEDIYKIYCYHHDKAHSVLEAYEKEEELKQQLSLCVQSLQ